GEVGCISQGEVVGNCLHHGFGPRYPILLHPEIVGSSGPAVLRRRPLFVQWLRSVFLSSRGFGGKLSFWEPVSRSAHSVLAVELKAGGAFAIGERNECTDPSSAEQPSTFILALAPGGSGRLGAWRAFAGRRTRLQRRLHGRRGDCRLVRGEPAACRCVEHPH